MRKSLEKWTNWFFNLRRSRKHKIQLFVDFFIILAAFFLAFLMRLESLEFMYLTDFYVGFLIVTATTFFVFTSLGLYKAFTRFISFDAVIAIAMGSLISTILLGVFTLNFDLTIPKSVPLIFGVLLLLMATSVRFTVRSLSAGLNRENKKNVAIYGADPKSIQIMNALKLDDNYNVCLFIDEKPELLGTTLSGIPIESSSSAINKLKKFSVKTLLLAAPPNAMKLGDGMFELLSQHPMAIKSIPSVHDLIDEDQLRPKLTEVTIEDLLGRDALVPDNKLMVKNTTNKTILVTGAGGSIGSEICRQIIQLQPKHLIIFDVSEYSIYTLLNELNTSKTKTSISVIPLVGSVQDRQYLTRIFEYFSIDTIYHAAAYKHVPLMEANVTQCIINNVFGTLNLAEQAVKAGVENFILISTDKAVNPTNVMGASKRLAELICHDCAKSRISTHFSIVRFGNVLGSSGSVVPLFKKQIEEGGPLTLTDPGITRYFMTIAEAAQLVIQAGAIKNSGAIFILDMGKPIKILDLAKKMVALSGRTISSSEGNEKSSESIFIKIVGLRPGEKMHEELSYGNKIMKSAHPKIMVANHELAEHFDIRKKIEELRVATDTGDSQKLLKTLKDMFRNISHKSEVSDPLINQPKSQ